MIILPSNRDNISSKGSDKSKQNGLNGPRTYVGTIRNATTGVFGSYTTLLFGPNGTLSVTDSNQNLSPILLTRKDLGNSLIIVKIGKGLRSILLETPLLPHLSLLVHLKMQLLGVQDVFNILMVNSITISLPLRLMFVLLFSFVLPMR